MSARCAHDPAGVVARQPLFASLSGEACRGLVARSVCRSVRRNELLFREGEPCRGLYLVVEGRVRTYCANRDGHEQVLGIYGAGESLGEVSLFDEGPYLASARAAEESRLLFLPIQEVQALYETRPEVARAVVRELAGRVRELTALVDRLALQDVPTRVAAAVLRFAEENGWAPFRLPRTQEELAGELGTSRESVARALHDLRGAEVIRQRGARIELLDVAELRRLASRTGSASQRRTTRGMEWSREEEGCRERSMSPR